MPRYLEYGRLAAEWATFTAAEIRGRSILMDGTATNFIDSTIYNGSTVVFYYNLSSNRTKLLVKVELDVIRGLIGHAPILLAADLACATYQTTGGSVLLDVYRIINAPDWADTTYRYRDTSAVLPWTGDAYSPLWGTDVALTPFASYTTPAATVYATEPDVFFDMTAELRRALLRGIDLAFMMTRHSASSIQTTLRWNTSPLTLNPYLRIWYLFGIEFFQAAADGSINLASMIDNADEDQTYYLGATERGGTTTPIKGWWKNLTSRTLTHVEILDDHGEPTDPEQTAGTGTGALHYVVLLDACGSQKYTVKMTSPTAYEVKAEAYRDNIESYHPAFDSDADWEGTTSTDFIAVEGGLTIPAAAWEETGLLANDEFVFWVRGNTTETAWPADSNEQVEMAHDDGTGTAADPATWRPIAGRRIKTTASVTIDATSKVIPVRPIQASQWPTGTPAFIADDTNIDEGTIGDVLESEIGTLVFTGSGLDDAAVSGEYHGNEPGIDLRIQIDGTGTPDTFKWSKDGGSNWEATTVAITGSPQHLFDNVWVDFGATTGHTSTDRWDCTVDPWTIELEGLTAGTNVYAVGSKVGTSLPFRDTTAAVWGQTTAAAGPSEALPNRVYFEDQEGSGPITLGIAPGDTLYIQDVSDSTVSEEGVVQTVAATYVNLVAYLTNDYPAGAWVAKKGTGERPFWLRVVALATTDEELKEVRLNARV
ncbi:MAG TPA: hypothetical protein PLN64_00915 [Candidatus Bipolaricaulis anaerobius]|nr:hypothetical protein [Candidatus Bipolaricaulis anaerobius]